MGIFDQCLLDWEDGQATGVLQQHQTELLHIWGYFQAEPKVSQMLFPRLAKKI